MPKAVFAVTNVKISSDPDGWFPAGSRIDVSKLNRDQLVELHDAGAVEIRIVDEEPADTTPPVEETAPETETDSNADSTDRKSVV